MAAIVVNRAAGLHSPRSASAVQRIFGARAGVHTFRQSSLTGDWIVYSSSRGNRPRQTEHAVARQRSSDFPEYVENCPFCRGNEGMTPEALLTYSAETVPVSSTEADWQLRVIPNKYPAIAPPPDGQASALEQQREMQSTVDDGDPTNNTIPAYGHHEVVVESPKHNANLATAPLDMTRRLVWAWRERGRALRRDKRIRHVHFFKNQGGTAGASLVHPHSQVVALPVVACNTQIRLDVARSFFVRHQTKVFLRMIEVEMKDGCRVLDDLPRFLSIVPYAAMCPFETLILPKDGGAYFEDIDDEGLEEFAIILHRSLRRLHTLLDEPSFNLTLRTAPYESRQAYDYTKFWSWRVNIYPRLGAGAMAGFEFGSGIFSNSMMPEDSARELQSVKL